MDILKRLARVSAILLAVIIARGVFVFIPGTYADSENLTEVTAVINPVASIAVTTSNLDIIVMPTDAGAFASDSVSVTVSSNSSAGYELYMSTEGSETAMVSEDSNQTISSGFSGTKTSATMSNNTWGYSLDNTNFSAIPNASNQAKIQDIENPTSITAHTTTINFGAKVDTTLSPGTYSRAIVFSMVAHEPYIDLFDINNMQEMNATVCRNTDTPTRYTAGTTSVRLGNDSAIPVRTLTDTRDGKTYTVAKFADGQCWMTQNLAYSFSEEHPVSSVVSDLHSAAKWVPTNGTSSTTGTWPSSVATANDRSYIENGTGYYNWAAATAGHTTETAGSTTEDSICPRGWRLPKRTGDGSFANLISTYSHVSTNDFFTGALNLDAAGYYPFGSGHVDGKVGWTDSGGTSYPNGGQSWYWTATTAESGTNQAYAFYAAKDGDKYPGIDTARDTVKGHGLAVRCVAR